MQLSPEQVAALAPDQRVVAAARGLANPRVWRNLARSPRALWGECQGTSLYQTGVDLADLVAHCTCPSRKQPCKHAIALLFLAATQPERLPETGEPTWVSAWIEERAGQRGDRAAKVAPKPAPVDPEAQAKRAARREGRVDAGLEQLDRWMDDLVRAGLASLPEQPPRIWDEQARRLVDAQAGALAGRLRGIGALVGASRDWPERVLDGLGRMALLTHAWRRQDDLDAGLRADVRAAIGFTTSQADVVAHGDLTDDLWEVLGQHVEEGERMRVQRSWLRGVDSRRWALLLQFAVGDANFAEFVPAGTRLRGRLAFYPSAFPQRAVLLERSGHPEPLSGPLGGFRTVAELADALASALARQPWLTRIGAALSEVRPILGEGWALADREQGVVPMRGADLLTLAAVSGGLPVDVAGEWDGRVFRPLAVVAEGRHHALRGEDELP